MPSYENKHLLRVLKGPQEVAKDFITYCKMMQVTSRGLCKVGYISRQPPRGSNPSFSPADPARYRLRGLIANKDIPKDENIIITPERSTLHPGAALRCQPFMSLFSQDIIQEYFYNKKFINNSRVMERSLIRHNQLLLAWYMTFLMLMRTFQPEALARMPGGSAIQYIDFFPRNEGQFDTLCAHLAGWLDTPEICRIGQSTLASKFQLTQAEVRPVILYNLCMIYSRMVPVDHKALLEFAFRETPLAGAFEAKPPSPAIPASGAPNVPVVPTVSPVVAEPIAFLCPMIDMCNHSAQENVAVMVPNDAKYQPSATVGPVICLRSLRDIRSGEELTMTYGAEPRELTLIWGMREILE